MMMIRFMFAPISAIIITCLLVTEITAKSALGVGGCHENEREALLRFKQVIQGPAILISSWISNGGGKDECCKWDGIVCDDVTGHVRELRLFNSPPPSYIEDEIDITIDEYNKAVDVYERSRLRGEISESLLNLTHLTHLDLSLNDFGGTPIPNFFGSLRSLRYLNLSRAGFGGVIPQQLGNLSSLQVLDLGSKDVFHSYPPYNLYVENLHWLHGLSSLQHLDLSNINLTKASDHWLQVINNNLPRLSELHLSYCGLDHIIPFPSELSYLNVTPLSVLDISSNKFSSSIFRTWIFNLSSLTSLDLGGNYIESPIPCGFRNMTALNYLDLSNNDLNASIPDCLYDVASLETLRLSHSNLQGNLSNAIQNLTSLALLDLSDNKLEGEIPTSMGNLCNVKKINLSGNKLSGQVWKAFESFSSGCALHGLESLRLDHNVFFGHLTDVPFPQFQNLRSLHLRRNSISGLLPVSIGGLTNLKSLHIGGNNLEGIVSELHFTNLTKLVYLEASGNVLTLKVDSDWIPPFQLNHLSLGSWHLGPQFPSWLRSQNKIWYLDLSSAQISETIPSWFWNLSSNLIYLNLSHNQIRGQLPDLINFTESSSIFLSSNQFSGPLPHTNPNVYLLDLSNNSFSGEISDFLCNQKGHKTKPLISNLHLGDNQLSGMIPDCWRSWASLQSINLNNNKLTGEIPVSIGELVSLVTLHLRNNNLSGILPSSLQKCTQLMILDIGKNQFYGRIPRWIGSSLSTLMVLSISSNKFKGQIPSELCQLSSLRIMDASGNNLSGKIPKCFNNFTAMVETQNVYVWFLSFYGGLDAEVLEGAYVMMKGNELQYDSVLSLVKSLDFSGNNLSGEIPEEVTSLVGLLSLNFSNNNLIGKIPDKMGDMTQLMSLDLSRNKLFGQIPATMSGLTFLSCLNLSYNMLSGEIPLDTQMQSFDVSSYVGNKLCGPPLTKSCNTRGDQTTQQKPPAKDDEEEEGVDWIIVFAVLGFVVGFAGIWLPLLVGKTWRYAYFKFLDSLWLKLDSAFISIWFGLKERMF